MQGSPNIRNNAGGLVGAVNEAAGEEGNNQGDAIIKLERRACEAELVAKPVDVEEGRGQLPEDEDAAIVIEEGAETEAVDDKGADGVSKHS